MSHRHHDDVLEFEDPEVEVRYLPRPQRRVTLFEGVVSSLVRGMFGAVLAVGLLVAAAVVAVVLFFAVVGWAVDQIPDGSAGDEPVPSATSGP